MCWYQAKGSFPKIADIMKTNGLSDMKKRTLTLDSISTGAEGQSCDGFKVKSLDLGFPFIFF